MDLPGSETEQVTHDRPRRSLAVVVVLAAVLLGLVGLSAFALVGHDTPRVVASTQAAGTAPHLAPTTVEPVSTTAVAIAAAAPVATTPSTTRWVPPTTVPTTPPATRPPTTAAPTTTPAVVTAASLQVQPATANFPSTPPPYWPMPIVHVTVTNTGRVTARDVVVHPVGVYSVPSSTCATLAPGQSCVAEVQFCPTSPSHYLNTLMVTGQDADTGSSLRASITLNGTAT